MAKHDALIVWRDCGDFATGRYSRAHEWRFDGGAVVRASSSPSVVPVPMSDAAGVDPEEALVASAASCHMLWFLSLAHQAGLIVERYADAAQGRMGQDERGKTALLTIHLRPQIVFAGRQPTRDELDSLHHEAHERCFIANTLRSTIVIETPAAP